ncbi:hypothetical protein ACFLZN_01195 [Nanoarchaeota archaeon]
MIKFLVGKEDLICEYSSIRLISRRCLEYPKVLPMKPSTVLAGIIADLTADGHIQGAPKWRIDYTSKSISELIRFRQEVYTISKIMGKIRPCTTNKLGISYNLGINNKMLAIVFHRCGAPTGPKVFTKFNLPIWICSDKEFFRRYFQRLLDCEGTVDVHSKCVELSMAKSLPLMNSGKPFFLDIREHLIRFFNIHSTFPLLESRNNRRKDNLITKQIRMKIKRKESILKLHQNIKFDNRQKQEKLKNIIHCYDENKSQK